MSTIKVNAIQNTSGVEQYLAKAWVNFNGTGTVAIRASGNVSSITDNGAGDYTVNFATAMADANYAVIGASDRGSPGRTFMTYQATTAPTTSAVRVAVGDFGTAYDSSFINIAVFR
jgi:hypothetical protein